jgi:hypothetical protein
VTTVAIHPASFGALRARLATTPGRLWLAVSFTLAVAALVGVVATAAAVSRHDAVASAGGSSEPLLVESAGLYASLADAEATAATTFLTGGEEPAARRRRYLADLRRATSYLTGLSERVGASPASVALGRVTGHLPVYSGLIETARANNREGFPVGAAYLRQASELMRTTLLPSGRRVYESEARALEGNYRSGVSNTAVVTAALACGALFVLLAGLSLWLFRLTHRVFNTRLVLGAAVIAALTGWVLAGLLVEQSALSRAQRNGSDAIELLAAARILVLREVADESLALVARGGGDQYLVDYDAVSRALGPPNASRGLLAVAAGAARRAGGGSSFDQLSHDLARYGTLHRRIAALEADGDFASAIGLAVGAHALEAPLAAHVDQDLAQQIDAAQRRFRSSDGDSASALRGLVIGIPLLVAVAGLLAAAGLIQRINEYR